MKQGQRYMRCASLDLCCRLAQTPFCGVCDLPKGLCSVRVGMRLCPPGELHTPTCRGLRQPPDVNVKVTPHLALPRLRVHHPLPRGEGF